MSKIAIIDTETNWADQVMSIGTLIVDSETFALCEGKYHIFPIECQIGGMYESTLFIDTPVTPSLCVRADAITELKTLFKTYGVTELFAYNACFDRNHLPEFRNFDWYDIMRLAAYRQYNSKIPACADCCRTGRLKRGYGVEAMLCLLSENDSYHESHNAYFDALDELQIMRLLAHPISDYHALCKVG